MKKKLFIKTYGCQMNVYDSNRMADVMKPHGYETVESPDEADLVVLNTCHIREKAAEKVYSDVGRIRMIKEERTAAGGAEMTIAVAGCVAQAEGAEMMKRAPVIDLVLGPQTYHRLPELVRSAEAGRKNGKPAHLLDTEFPSESKFDFLPEESDLQGPAAFLAVQEGCDKFCTFCVVPYTRGAEYSRPMADLMTEARRLVSKGVRDITLLGQNVNAYHGDDGKGGTATLGGLIRALADIDGLARIRYTTSHPRDMDDELISAHRDVAACMPYLHLPVQSGSDRILAAMNRKHTAESYLDVIRRLRDARPDLALSSDFIVGFPGEKDEDFEATMALVREVGYAQSFSFKYSARPGTPASVMPFQVPEDVKSERLAALQALLAEQQLAFNTDCLGKVMDVLVERPGKRDGEVVGRSPYLQAVHIDVTGSDYTLDEGTVPTYSDLMGQMVRVEIRDAGPGNLRGVIAA